MTEAIFCLRGFEACVSAKAVQQRLLRRVAALQAVIDTQFVQKQQGFYDPRRIQADYHRATGPDRRQALKRAALDAVEVAEEGKEGNSQGPESGEEVSLKNQFDRLMRIKAGSVQPSLRSAASGPLQLRKTVPNTA